MKASSSSSSYFGLTKDRERCGISFERTHTLCSLAHLMSADEGWKPSPEVFSFVIGEMAWVMPYKDAPSTFPGLYPFLIIWVTTITVALDKQGWVSGAPFFKLVSYHNLKGMVDNMFTAFSCFKVCEWGVPIDGLLILSMDDNFLIVVQFSDCRAQSWPSSKAWRE